MFQRQGNACRPGNDDNYLGSTVSDMFFTGLRSQGTPFVGSGVTAWKLRCEQ